MVMPSWSVGLSRQCVLRRQAGYETIMLNSNPETVSTDYDTSSRLYFEPLTVEDVLEVIRKERPEGIIVQFGGQTPLNLANGLEKALKENPLPAASGVFPPLAGACPRLSAIRGTPGKGLLATGYQKHRFSCVLCK